MRIKKILAAAIAALCLCSCNASAPSIDVGADGVLTYDDFYGKRFSILVGSIFDEVADKNFAPKDKLYFNNVVEEIEAVKLGKTDAALLDDTAAAQSLESGAYPELTAIDVPIAGLDLPYGVFSTNQDIIDKYNAFLAEIEADGTLAEMQDRWLRSYALEATMPDIKMPENPTGTLKVAIMATYAPFTFLGSGGEFMGFDIEQMKRFAASMNMDVEFIDMDFGAMLPFVASGKADIGGSVYATAERKESFIFGNPDYVSKTVLVVKKPQQD
ncbi:MAG: transporter substrate-binding domain-containing protein [Ruminococcus sp.]|nr:transporter substrate-binding domain-containing protein [Ruminococcus sp.]